MPFDIRFDDWNELDMQEDVTLAKVRPDGSVTNYSGVQAIAEPDSPEDPADAAGVQITPPQNVWHIRSSSLPTGVRPARGDRLVSTSEWASGVWLIKSVRNAFFGVRWVCQTQLLDDPPG